MKEELIVSRKTIYVLHGIWLTIILIGGIYFTRKWLAWNDQLEVFKSRKINSPILSLRDLTRGSYQIKVKVGDRITNFSLPIAFEVAKNKIQVGDSLSKSEHTGRFDVYRKTNHRTIKVSEIDIY